MENVQDVDFLDAFEKEIEAKDASDLQKAQEKSDLISVMDTPEGERVLRRILAETKPFGLSYTRGDTHETAYREGMRRVGLWLLAQMGDANAELCNRVAHNIGARNGHNDTASR